MTRTDIKAALTTELRNLGTVTRDIIDIARDASKCTQINYGKSAALVRAVTKLNDACDEFLKVARDI